MHREWEMKCCWNITKCRSDFAWMRSTIKWNRWFNIKKKKKHELKWWDCITLIRGITYWDYVGYNFSSPNDRLASHRLPKLYLFSFSELFRLLANVLTLRKCRIWCLQLFLVGYYLWIYLNSTKKEKKASKKDSGFATQMCFSTNTTLY